MEVLNSATCPFQCIGLFCAERFFGTICAQEYGTICANQHGTICTLISWSYERCQIVCVYLTCFLNWGLRDNLCPLPDSGLPVPSIYGIASEFEVSISLCLFDMFLNLRFRDQLCPLSDLGPSLPTSVDLFVKSCVGLICYLLLLPFISF